jgi:lactoylglutathione lyase
MKIGSVKLVVRDLDAIQAFYRETFAMVLHRVIEDEALTDVILKWPDAGEAKALLILLDHKDARDIVVGTGYGPLGFYVPDIDAIIEHAVCMGTTLIQPAADLPLFRLALINDPEGHELELLAPPNSKPVMAPYLRSCIQGETFP